MVGDESSSMTHRQWHIQKIEQSSTALELKNETERREREREWMYLCVCLCVWPGWIDDFGSGTAKEAARLRRCIVIIFCVLRLSTPIKFSSIESNTKHLLQIFFKISLVYTYPSKRSGWTSWALWLGTEVRDSLGPKKFLSDFPFVFTRHACYNCLGMSSDRSRVSGVHRGHFEPSVPYRNTPMIEVLLCIHQKLLIA